MSRLTFGLKHRPRGLEDKKSTMFITFEGLDGSGKTTQIPKTVDYLQKKGFDVITTREPGGTPIGDAIREVLHSLKHMEMHPHTELLLYVASRAQLVAEIIRPHLKQGTIVISDRFADSTLAYQGYGHGLPLETLKAIIHFATGNLQPDLTLYFDISPEESLRRRHLAAKAGEEFNRLDAQSRAFYDRVYEGYQALMAADTARWAVIDATQEVEKVQASIVMILNARLLIP